MKHRKILKIQMIVSTLILIGVFGLTGCATTSPEKDEPGQKAAKKPGAQNIATVLKVNKDLGYVILETIVAPQVGQEAEIKRRGKAVGVIKVTDDQSLPFVAADVVSGNVFVGDAVLLEPAQGEE